jgi:hypothetical protein
MCTAYTKAIVNDHFLYADLNTISAAHKGESMNRNHFKYPDVLKRPGEPFKLPESHRRGRSESDSSLLPSYPLLFTLLNSALGMTTPLVSF